MKKQVFYSWQSDLPNNTNRIFIEDCIKSALRELNNDNEYIVEYRIDKDTSDMSGTPHIAESIFSKIENSYIFIADVSIINADYEKRKTPNPNVLIELGYAIKVLGWERIICVFNKDFGDFDDLPFDIRHRQPLIYSTNDIEKDKAKKNIVDLLKNNIKSYYKANREVVRHNVGTYIVLEASTFYENIEKALKRILEDERVRKKFPFLQNNYIIEVWDDFEYRFDNEQPCEEQDIEYMASIVFVDDNYSYGGVDDRECSVFFEFKEKFKQCNFGDKKVYSIFEIVSHGYSPSNIDRNYEELSDEVLNQLCNMNI